MREELGAAAPVAPLVEDVLNAAHHVAAAGLEMDARLDPALHGALLRLVHAVYEHEDSLDLLHELEIDGVREAHVFEVSSRRPPVTSYTAHVERVIEAAHTVARCASAGSEAVPPYALTPLGTLVEAVTTYSAHCARVHEWEQAGHRLRVIPGGQAQQPQPEPASQPPTSAAPTDDDQGLASHRRGGQGFAAAHLEPPHAVVDDSGAEVEPAVRERPVPRLRLR